MLSLAFQYVTIDGKDDGAQKPASKPDSALSNTGASVFGVGITAVTLLVAAGAAYTLRKRQAELLAA